MLNKHIYYGTDAGYGRAEATHVTPHHVSLLALVTCSPRAMRRTVPPLHTHIHITSQYNIDATHDKMTMTMHQQQGQK